MNVNRGEIAAMFLKQKVRQSCHEEWGDCVEMFFFVFVYCGFMCVLMLLQSVGHSTNYFNSNNTVKAIKRRYKIISHFTYAFL